MTTCACGCGKILKSANSTWSPGHWRRGRAGYQLAEKSVKPSEMGTTGTSIFAGQFATDINSTFNDRETRLDRYEKMEKTDSSCRALYSVVTLPIRSINWWVEPASDANEDQVIAKSITWNLVDGMTKGWYSFLQECLTCVSRGFSVFEKVFQTATSEDFTGTIMWRKFAFRAQRTIDEWRLDNTGGLEAIHQEFSEGDHPISTWIPVEKSLVFTYQMEGSNFEGDSLFRPCWRDWFYKDALQRIEAIGLERFWVGVPGIKLPKHATTADSTKAFEIVSELRADEAGGVVLPNEWELFIERVATEGGTMNEVIERYTRNIFLTGLAQFLALGSKDVGSWALSRDQSLFFLFALNAIADFIISDTMNKHAIPQLVKMNWPNVTKFPKMKHDDLEQIDLGGFATTLKTFVDAGGLSMPDVEIEKEIRQMSGLPEMNDEIAKAKLNQQKEYALNPAPPPGEQFEQKKQETKKEEDQEEKKGAKMAEAIPLFTPGEIAMAVIEFNGRSPIPLMDAHVA